MNVTETTRKGWLILHLLREDNQQFRGRKYPYFEEGDLKRSIIDYALMYKESHGTCVIDNK